MIDWTVAQHTRRAVWRVTQNFRFGPERACRQRARRSEDYGWRTAERCRDVRGAGVVRHDEIDELQHRGDLVQRRLARQSDRLLLHPVDYLTRHVDFISRTDQHDLSPRLD